MNNLIQDLLKSKVIFFFAGFGALFSIIVGVISRVDFLVLMLRAILGAAIMSILWVVLQLFLKKSLSEEDYQSLFGLSDGPGEPVSTQDEALPQMKRPAGLDVTDDTGLSPADIYKDSGLSGDETEQEQDNEAPSAVPAHTAGADSGDSFQNEDFQKVRYDGDSSYDDQKEDNVLRQKDMSTGSQSLANDMKVMKEIQRGTGDIRLKMGNKIVNTDAKVVAGAIKTILRRE